MKGIKVSNLSLSMNRPIYKVYRNALEVSVEKNTIFYLKIAKGSKILINFFEGTHNDQTEISVGLIHKFFKL